MYDLSIGIICMHYNTVVDQDTYKIVNDFCDDGDTRFVRKDPAGGPTVRPNNLRLPHKSQFCSNVVTQSFIASF